MVEVCGGVAVCWVDVVVGVYVVVWGIVGISWMERPRELEREREIGFLEREREIGFFESERFVSVRSEELE